MNDREDATSPFCTLAILHFLKLCWVYTLKKFHDIQPCISNKTTSWWRKGDHSDYIKDHTKHTDKTCSDYNNGKESMGGNEKKFEYHHKLPLYLAACTFILCTVMIFSDEKL